MGPFFASACHSLVRPATDLCCTALAVTSNLSAIQLADKVGADFILGTDPDSDRVGIMVRSRDAPSSPSPATRRAF